MRKSVRNDSCSRVWPSGHCHQPQLILLTFSTPHLPPCVSFWKPRLHQGLWPGTSLSIVRRHPSGRHQRKRQPRIRWLRLRRLLHHSLHGHLYPWLLFLHVLLSLRAHLHLRRLSLLALHSHSGSEALPLPSALPWPSPRALPDALARALPDPLALPLPTALPWPSPWPLPDTLARALPDTLALPLPSALPWPLLWPLPSACPWPWPLPWPLPSAWPFSWPRSAWCHCSPSHRCRCQMCGMMHHHGCPPPLHLPP